MTEVTTLYGLLAVIVTSICTPIVMHILQRKNAVKDNIKQAQSRENSDIKIDHLITQLTELDIAIQRMDMIMFMNTNPFNRCTHTQKAKIEKKYKKYQEVGGHEWFDDVYDQWISGTMNNYTTEMLNELTSFCAKQHQHNFETIQKIKDKQKPAS